MALQTETPAPAANHDPFAVGAILYSSWGYEQTNIDFYQIVGRSKSGSTITIREVAAVVVDSARGADYVMPRPDQFIGDPLKKRISRHKDVKLSSFQRAWPWDGKRKYQTAAGYGH